jgi:hypothetical protein
MHRSGTSAFTRTLNLLGCDLPKTLMNAGKGNEIGHWESQVICELNDRILRSGGSTWHDWRPFNPNWSKSPRANEFLDEARATLAAEFGSSRLFVLKDPRICRLPAFWLAALEAFGATPFAVLPLRNPLEVAGSLAKRDGFDPSIGQLLWLRHVLDAERATRGRPRVFVTYDGLMNSWHGTIERIQAAAGFTLPRLAESATGEIEQFLSGQLHHERATPAGVIDNPGLSAWLRQSFAILDGWARHGEDTADRAALDRIGAAFDAAVPAFARPVEIGLQAAAAQRRLEAELATTRAQSAEREARISGLERDAGAANKDLADVRGRLAQTESALAQRQHETDQRAAELAAARRDLQQLAAWRAEADTLLAGYKDHIALLLANERDRQAADAERQREIAALQKRSGEAAAEVQRLSSEKQAIEAQLEDNRDEFQQYKAKSTAEEQKLKSEKQAVEERLKERFDEIATLTRLVKDKESEAGALRRSIAGALEAGRVSVPLIGGSVWWKRLWVRRKAAALTRSGWFDPAWYLEKYPDVKKAGMNPAEHYVRFGAREGRLPRAIGTPH